MTQAEVTPWRWHGGDAGSGGSLAFRSSSATFWFCDPRGVTVSELWLSSPSQLETENEASQPKLPDTAGDTFFSRHVSQGWFVCGFHSLFKTPLNDSHPGRQWRKGLASLPLKFAATPLPRAGSPPGVTRGRGRALGGGSRLFLGDPAEPGLGVLSQAVSPPVERARRLFHTGVVSTEHR